MTLRADVYKLGKREWLVQVVKERAVLNPYEAWVDLPIGEPFLAYGSRKDATEAAAGALEDCQTVERGAPAFVVRP